MSNSGCRSMSGQPYGAMVRLRYAVIINYVTNALSLITSLFFVLIVTRKLSVTEFSVWTMIFSYINYMVIFTAIYGYWLPRTISRGINTAKTGVVLSSMFGGIASLLYLPIIYAASRSFNQPLAPLLLSTVLLFENYVYRAMNAIASSHKPQYVGIGNLTIKISQAILAVVALILLRAGLIGAVSSVAVARAVGLSLMVVVNRDVIRSSSFSWEVAKTWVKRSWLPLYGSLIPSLAALDTVVALSLGHSEVAITYYGVAMSVSGVASRPLMSTRPALYSRILAKGERRDVDETFWISYAFSVPIVAGIVAYVKPVLAIFNPRYLDAALPTQIFSIAVLLIAWRNIISTTLSGLEKADLMHSDSKSLVGSVLFKLPSTNYVSVAVYLLLVGAFAHMFSGDPFMIALGWSIAFLARQLGLLVAFNVWSIKMGVRPPYRKYAGYVSRFVVAALPIIPISMFIHVPVRGSIYEMIPPALLVFTLFTGLYVSILFAIDPKMRELVEAAMRELGLRRQGGAPPA